MIEALGNNRFWETREDGSEVIWDHDEVRYIKKLWKGLTYESFEKLMLSVFEREKKYNNRTPL